MGALVAIRLTVCSERHHSRLRTGRAWSTLRLIGYMEAAEEGCYLELRNCHCHDTLAVAFRPDAGQLEAVRRMEITPIQLAGLMAQGSREAGIVLQERTR